MTDPLSEFDALTEDEDVRAAAGRLREQLRQAKADRSVDQRTIKDLREELEQARDAIRVMEAARAATAPEWLTPVLEPGKRRGTLVACFSDYHFGEVVDPGEMNGYNAYNPDIAAQRIRRFFERTIRMARQYLTGVEYDGIVLASLGDTISGDIHEELRETNGLSNAEAVPEILPLLQAGIDMWAEEFGLVHYVGVPGNHPRDTRKPRYKGRSAHNADTMISKLLAAHYSGVDGVTFDVPDSFSADLTVYDTRFRMEHGDEAKGGSGIQGALLPITLRTHRVRKQAQAEGVPFDVLLLGHWHQLMSVPSKGFLVNGCGKGYDEYARGKAFEPEPPQQALLLVTPEHKIGVQAPIFVGDRAAEGW